MGNEKRMFKVRLTLFYFVDGGSGSFQTLVPIYQNLQRHVMQNPKLQNLWFSNLLLISIMSESQKYKN
jgi:hypothetical protein